MKATHCIVFGANREMHVMIRQNDVTRGGYPMAITGIQLSSYGASIGCVVG